MPVYYYISPDTAVFEVAFDPSQKDSDFLWCSCPGYTVKKSCRHISIARQSINKEALLSRDEQTIDWENLPEMSSQEFRYFIIQNMRIEVLAHAGE